MEKQRILQAGVNRSMHLTDSCKENQTLAIDKNGSSQSSRSHLASVKKMIDAPNPTKFRECEIAAPPASSNLSSAINNAVATKLKSTESTKKPIRGGFNFFERYNGDSLFFELIVYALSG